MRAAIQNYIRAERDRREENDEKGFSLIELIVVVVILGILAAIAIPVFMGIQGQAQENSLKATTSSAASQAVSQAAMKSKIDVSKLATDGVTLTVAGTTIDNICVTGTKTGVTTQTAGPGC